jgi:O-antigen ligase
VTMATRAHVPWWAVERGGASRTAFAALCAFTFVLLLAPQASHPALAALHLAAVAAVAAAVAHAMSRAARNEPVLVVPRGTGPALALGAWALATAPLSLWPGGSVQVFLDMFAKSLVICWLLPQVIDTEARLQRLVTGMCIAGGVLALYALLHLGGGFMSGDVDAVKGTGGYDAPLTRNANDLALMLNLLVPLGWALLRSARSPVVRVALAAIVAAQVAAILVTFSRAGFLTLAAVWTWHALRSLHGRARVTAVALALVVAAAPAFLPEGYRRFLGTTTDMSADTTGSSQARWGDAVAATGVIADQPLVGAGLGQNVLAITRETGTWRMVHNVYLQVAADLGLPGLVLFLAFLAGCLGAVRSVCRGFAVAPRPGPVLHLARGLELSLAAFVVAGMFHPVAYNFYLYYIGGLALAARSIHEAGRT